MGFEDITATTEAGVAWITLNRPDRLNAWTRTMEREVRDAVIAAGDDPAARVVVVTGAGRGFCAGADMDALKDIGDGEGDHSESRMYPDPPRFTAPGPDIAGQYPGRFGYLYACPKPVIAAINGPCAGIGLIFALYCDMRYAAESAKFTTAFAARGLIAEHGISWLLPRLVGEARAMDLLLSARVFKGAEAAAMGLVNAALPEELLMDEVQEIARRFAEEVSPRSMAVMKAQIRRAYGQSYAEALLAADAEMAGSFASPDFKEGVASFVERRKPAFPSL